MKDGLAAKKLVMLGFGQVAAHVAALADGYKLIATTRDITKKQKLEEKNILPFVIEQPFSIQQQEALANCIDGANVLVSFPPDGESDILFSKLCTGADGIIYISSTSVYGKYTGIIDEQTSVDEDPPKNKLRLQAEKIWLSRNAIVLRAPGLYGPSSGLHLRLPNGSYRLPPEPYNYISRIHLKDLARIILAGFAKPLPDGSIYLVGDLKPVPQIEVIEWLCRKMNLPLPPAATPDTVPVTMTSNRQINPGRILKELNFQPEFPTYQEGYADCLKCAGNVCTI